MSAALEPGVGVPWAEVKAMLEGILQRRYYTNHGPAARALEQTLAAEYGARHAVAMTNPAIGLVMMLEGLNLAGSVLVALDAPPRIAQAISWAGLTPVFFENEPAAAAGSGIGAIVAIAGPDGVDQALAEVARAHGVALCTDGLPEARGAHPALLTLPTGAGRPDAACILTDDDAYAARLRNIRSSYGAGPHVPVRRTANGRLSEAQAGMVLLAMGRGAERIAG